MHKKKKYQRISRHFRIVQVFKSFWRTIREDLELLKDTPFVLFLLSNLLLYTFYDIPYVNLPEYAIEALDGVSDEKASFLVSIIGIVNTFGMLLYGALADCEWVNNVLWYAISILVCGVAILVGLHIAFKMK